MSQVMRYLKMSSTTGLGIESMSLGDCFLRFWARAVASTVARRNVMPRGHAIAYATITLASSLERENLPIHTSSPVCRSRLVFDVADVTFSTEMLSESILNIKVRQKHSKALTRISPPVPSRFEKTSDPGWQISHLSI